MRRRVTGVVLALAASSVLVGCSLSPADEVLARPASAADALPEWAVGSGPVSPDRARLLGEHNGVSYFLTEASSPRVDTDYCVVAVAEQPAAMSVCWGDRGGGGGGGQVLGSFVFEPGGMNEEDIPEGSVLVHPTLAVGD